LELDTINQLGYAVKYVLGLDRAGNNLTVFPDDTFIVSHPKSGNTWMRFLIGNLIYPEGVDFSNIALSRLLTRCARIIHTLHRA